MAKAVHRGHNSRWLVQEVLIVGRSTSRRHQQKEFGRLLALDSLRQAVGIRLREAQGPEHRHPEEVCKGLEVI